MKSAKIQQKFRENIFFKNLLFFFSWNWLRKFGNLDWMKTKLAQSVQNWLYYVLPLTTKEYLIVTTLDSSLIIVSKSCARWPLIKGWPREPSRICQFWGERERERLQGEECKNVNSLTSSLNFSFCKKEARSTAYISYSFFKYKGF